MPRSPIPTRLLLLLALTFIGCDSKVSADKASQSSEAKEKTASTAPSPTASEAPVPPTSTPPILVKPRAHAAMLAVVDFSKFANFDGAFRQSASPLSVGFSLEKKDASDMKRTISAMETFLAEHGWKPAPDTAKDAWTDDGGIVFYQKEGATVQATAGVSRGSAPDSKDINAGLFLIGEVDARSLPRLPGTEVVSGDFSATRFTVPAEVLAVRKFHTTELTAQGWTEFRPHIPGGRELTMEDKTREQSFVQNGATISYTLETKGSLTEVSVRCTLMEKTLPIPPQPDMLELQDSPPLMSCFVKMSPEEILTWTQEALGKDWTAAPLPAKEERTILHRFEKAGEPPLLLECLADKTSTFMRIREPRE